MNKNNIIFLHSHMTNLVPVRNFNIESEKMNLVLKKRRVKFTWEDLINDYLTYGIKKEKS